MKIKVCLAGATGRVGRCLVNGILKSKDLELVSAVSRTYKKQNLGKVLNNSRIDLVISGSVAEALRTTTDVLIDYTHPHIVKSNVLCAVNNGVNVVIGTSGLTDDDYKEIDVSARLNRVGVLAGGNFAITASLMQRFALIAAKYIPQWEIIDYADVSKIDAPSGTTHELASRLCRVRKPVLHHLIEETHGAKESRGATVSGSQIHSIRLPGYDFSAEVIFGLPNERLIIRHEAINSAEPYVAGTLLAVRKVSSFVGVVKGIDNFIE
jgi:4-hydroxy-tetrahydrodipicolinate reductase